MERSNNKKIRLIAAAVLFYLIVTFLSLLLMNKEGSVFSNNVSFFSKDKEDTEEVEAVPAGKDEEPSAGIIHGSVERSGKEEPGGDASEAASEEASDSDQPSEEAQTMVMGGDGNITVQSGVLAEGSEEGEEAEPPAETKKYYRFTTINTEGGLRMREEPDPESNTIYKLSPGSEGYVLELGDDWSYIAAEDHVGYCSNEFLSLTEIPEDEYPEELR